MDITGKTALITGAASGIGLAAAHQLVQRRIGRLMLADLNEAAFEHIRQDLKTEENQEIECRRVDVSKVGEIAGLYDRLNSRFGAPDIVFNCAGIVTGAPGFPDVSVEHIEKVISVNLVSAAVSTKLAVDAMKASGGGVIVNMGSTGAFNPNLPQAPYSAAKAGIVMLSQSCKALHGEYGIRVNALCPGITETAILDATGDGQRPDWLHELMKSKKIWSAQEMAEQFVLLCEDDSVGGEYRVFENPELPK
ncbi:SDR family NAD(P)-dependent oxidoreductase [Rhizorhapis sp. SPR117]|uniref:SDR family NAD(P)-dependent oxidoreductase n=1 Tax=Rhizorhapis sp. SPR117 TaxID=2912611 RepID=UPI001F388311|nr:SDR family oxidoreductase [Rhizorhapis sp. SPR117]